MQFVTRHYSVVWVPDVRPAPKRMQHRALGCFRRLVPALPERAVRSDGFPVATRHHDRKAFVAAIKPIGATYALEASTGVQPEAVGKVRDASFYRLTIATGTDLRPLFSNGFVAEAAMLPIRCAAVSLFVATMRLAIRAVLPVVFAAATLLLSNTATALAQPRCTDPRNCPVNRGYNFGLKIVDVRSLGAATVEHEPVEVSYEMTISICAGSRLTASR